MSKSKSEDSQASNSSNLIEIPPSDITKLQSIGVGGFSEVFLGRWEGNEVAIKQLHLKSLTPSLYEDFLREAEILAKCRHPSVVTFFGISKQEKCFQLILEYLPRGNLFQSLSDASINMPMPLRIRIALDIARGLKYLHFLDILHKDLKSMNILLTNDWKAKITDFGLARIKLETQATSTHHKATSIRWCAPEIFKRSPRTRESDVWSLGVVFWEISSRKIPYAEELNETIILNYIKDGVKEDIPADCPSFLSEIINKCWNMNPKDRPDASQIVPMLESSLQSEMVQEKEPVKTVVTTFKENSNGNSIHREDAPFQFVGDLSEILPDIFRADISENGMTARTSKYHGNAIVNKEFLSGIHYWEFEVQPQEMGVRIGIGVAKVVKEAKRLVIGREEGTWALVISEGGRGFLMEKDKAATILYTSILVVLLIGEGEVIRNGVIIGVLLNCDECKLRFFHNGKDLGDAFTLPRESFIPVVTLFTGSLTIRKYESREK